MKGNGFAEMREKFREAGWVMQGGPCDETTKKPNAGVGVAAREASKVVVVQGERNTKNFQNAWLAGRAEKIRSRPRMGGKRNMLCHLRQVRRVK